MQTVAEVLVAGARKSIYESFDYRRASAELASAHDLLHEADPRERAAGSPLAEITAEMFELRAIVLRDRLDRRAEDAFDMALRMCPSPARRRAVATARVTARINRCDLTGATQALGEAFALGAHPSHDPDLAAKVGRLLELRGSLQQSMAVTRHVIDNRATPAQEASARSALARQLVRAAAHEPTRERLSLLREAVLEVERAHELLDIDHHGVWTVTHRASTGLVFAAIGDHETALDLYRDAVREGQRVGIRNYWIESLGASLAVRLDDAGDEESLAVAWARYRHYKRRSPRLAFLELERGFEHLLRCIATWDGSTCSPNTETSPGMRLWRAAVANATQRALPSPLEVVSTAEVRSLLRIRNAVAHRVSAPDANVERDSAKLCEIMFRLEQTIPLALLGAAVGEFRFGGL